MLVIFLKIAGIFGAVILYVLGIEFENKKILVIALVYTIAVIFVIKQGVLAS